MILTRQLCARIHYTPPVPISNFLSAYLNGSVVNIFQKFQERCIWCCITWMLKKWIIWQNNSYLQPYQGKKVREKWLNSLQVTKFFPDFLFPDQIFSPRYFFTWQRIYPNYFFQLLLLLLLFPIYLQNLLLPCFFWCTLFIVVEQSSFEKNNNNNDINTTRSCTFVIMQI